jgi:hypothetical protein
VGFFDFCRLSLSLNGPTATPHTGTWAGIRALHGLPVDDEPEVRGMPDHAAIARELRFVLQERKALPGGLLVAEVWRV